MGTRLDNGDTSTERAIGAGPLGIAATRDAATQGYDNLLLTRLLPAMLGQLARRLQQVVASGASAEILRPLLVIYLMLGDPAHCQQQTVATWGADLIGATYPLDPTRKAAALSHFQQPLTLLPAPVTLNQRLIAQARLLSQQSPNADVIYARLKQDSLSSGAASPLDVVASLGAAGSQLLMLRSQAGLPVVVPALYTRAGFYQIFVPQAPVLTRNANANDWIMGSSDGGSTAETSVVLQQVANDYERDYIKQWQSVLAQVSLRALPDITSLTAGLQTLSGPDSPLTQLIQMVRTQTDLGVPPPPSSLLSKATSAVRGAAGSLAQDAASQLAPQSANPLGLDNWPGDAIRVPFGSLQALLSASSGQSPVLRVQDTLAAAYGVIAGIASAQDPGTAAQQAAAQVISAQGADPMIGLRVQAATLPRPVDGIFRELYQNIWGTLLRMAGERIQADWARDVAPVCEQSIARRYPFVAEGGQFSATDVTLSDFANFFGPRA